MKTFSIFIIFGVVVFALAIATIVTGVIKAIKSAKSSPILDNLMDTAKKMNEDLQRDLQNSGLIVKREDKPKPKKIKCPYCGSVCKDTETKCPSCGAGLDDIKN